MEQQQAQENYEQSFAQQSEMNSQNLNNLSQMSPDSNYESAVFLLENSDTFASIPEIEKEIKLGNFDSEEKPIIQTLLNSYQDLILLNDLQLQKFQSKLKPKDYQIFKRSQNLAKLDKLNFLRRAVSISTVSRGTDGFERKSQNTIISKSSTDFDSNDEKVSKLKQIFGGGQR